MPVNSLPNVDYTARDYTTIKASLKRYVQTFFGESWSDFYEGDLGVVILEMVAWLGDNLSFNLDQNAREVFIQTALQRPNVLRLSRMLGYAPRTATASVVPLRLSLAVAQAASVVIAAYTSIFDQARTEYEILEATEIPIGVTDTYNQQVTAEVLGLGDGVSTTYTFTTAHDKLNAAAFYIGWTAGTVQYTAQGRADGTIRLQGGGSGTIDYDTGDVVLNFAATYEPDLSTNVTATYQWSQRVNAYQGRTRLDRFSSAGTSFQSFSLTRTSVLVDALVRDTPPSPDPSRFEVWIGDPGAPFGTGTGVMWTRIDSLTTATATDEVYEVVIDEDDGVTIRFGDDVTGMIPASGSDNIFVIYRTGGGLAGNISQSYISANVVGTTGSLAVSVAVNNPEPGSGGAERESVEEIRINAPQFARTNDTATTESDFDSIAGTYALPGTGAIVRAKSRLTPPEILSVRVVLTDEILTVVPAGTPTEYYLRIPGAAPIGPTTVSVTYTISATPHTVAGVDLGSGLARLASGGGTLDTALTRFRYDSLDYLNALPGTFVGDGTDVTFSDTGTLKPPILPRSVVVKYTIGGTDYVGYDDGAGAIFGSFIGAGTINYATGAISLNFSTQAELISGNAEPFNLQAITGGAVDFFLDIDGAGPNDLTFSALDFVDYSAATALEFVTAFNLLASPGATADVVGGRVRIRSDSFGTGSSLLITGGAPGDANDPTNGLNFPLTLAEGEANPPDNLTPILIDYEACLRLVLLSAPDLGTEITMSLEMDAQTRQLPSNNIEVYTWSFDADGNLTAPNSALRDSLKAYLDLRRVLCTSVEVLSGFNVRVSLALTVEYDPAVSQSDTNTRIVDALAAYFRSLSSVRAGEDLAIAALYQEIFPIYGVKTIVLEEVGVRVPVAIGDGATTIFKTDTASPGKYVSTGKLPAVLGTVGAVKVYKGDTQTGESDTSTPTATIDAVSGLMLPNSTFNKTTGTFDLRFTPAPALDVSIEVEYTLDETGADGHSIWNVAIEPWEVAVLGSVLINGVQIQ